MQKYKGLIYTYETKEEFLNLCGRKDLQRPFAEQKSQRKFFDANSWQQRGNAVLKAIDDYRKQKENSR